MDKLINTLIRIIKEEETLLTEFIKLLEEQKKLLVENDVESFEETAVRQEDLVEQIRSLENRRVEIVKEVATNTETAESEITLTRLVEMSLGNVSEELADAKKNLTNLVSRIKKMNQVNQYLIKRSLNKTQRTIDFLIDSDEQDITYESNGLIRDRNAKAVLINKTL